MRTKRFSKKGMWINILLFLLAVIFLVPFYICIVTAFKTPAETAVSTWSLPKGLDLSNFAEAMEKSNFLQSFGNSIFITVVSTLGIVLFSAMMAYSICRNQESRLYRMFGSALFIGIMIPFQVIMIPVYKMFKNMGLLNTYRGIIILMIGTSLPYASYLVMGFIKSIPVALEDAARIDGCNIWQTFWKIVFPLLKPITSTVGILHVLWMWNEFNMSFIVLQKEAMRTLPNQQYHFFGQFTINLNLGFASACLSMIPVIIFFLFAQKLLISGITNGAVKG